MSWEFKSGAWYLDGNYWGERYDLPHTFRAPIEQVCPTCGAKHLGQSAECGRGGAS